MCVQVWVEEVYCRYCEGVERKARRRDIERETERVERVRERESHPHTQVTHPLETGIYIYTCIRYKDLYIES